MPKFKIGEFVTLVGCGDKLKLFVLGIIQETCYGGCQIHYTCRMFCREHFGDKGWYPATSKDGVELRRYSEIELIPFIENPEKTGVI